MKKYQVKVNTDKCTGCGLCSRVCVSHNLIIRQGKAKIIMDKCIMCGQCSAVCPQKAISINGYGSGQIEKTDEVRLNPLDLLNAIRFRRSIRNFKKTEIPKEVIEQILAAGRFTHTAKNMQDVSYVVLIEKRDAVEKMAVKLFQSVKPIANLFIPMARNLKITDHFFFFNAPAVIVILAKDKTNGIPCRSKYGICRRGKWIRRFIQWLFYSGGKHFAQDQKGPSVFPKGKKWL